MVLSFISPIKPTVTYFIKGQNSSFNFGNYTLPITKDVKVPLMISLYLILKQVIHPLSDIDDVDYQVTHANFLNKKYPNLKYIILFLVVLSDAYIVTTGWQNTFFYNILE
jgi:hypothetical protein